MSVLICVELPNMRVLRILYNVMYRYNYSICTLKNNNTQNETLKITETMFLNPSKGSKIVVQKCVF